MMVRKHKWLDGVRSDDPVSDAARHALEQRLDLVWHYVVRAADRRPEPEDVHQLRVAARRAVAAFDAYAELLPPRRFEWFQKQLRKIRKAANDARDLDVMLVRLGDRAESESPQVWKPLIKRIKRLRDEAHEPIVAIYKQLHRRDWEHRVEQLVDRVGWRDESRPEPSFAEAARLQLEQLAAPFFAAARSDWQSIDDLHAFRIAGKRLRYGIELFASLSPMLRSEVYPHMEQLQERLGEINDHAAAVVCYTQWLEAWSDEPLAPAVQMLQEEERAALGVCRASFVAWWTTAQADELQQQFHAALGRASSQPVA